MCVRFAFFFDQTEISYIFQRCYFKIAHVIFPIDAPLETQELFYWGSLRNLARFMDFHFCLMAVSARTNCKHRWHSSHNDWDIASWQIFSHQPSMNLLRCADLLLNFFPWMNHRIPKTVLMAAADASIDYFRIMHVSKTFQELRR